MSVIVLAALSALVYGASDFYGGLATRRARVLLVIVAAQVSGLLVLAPALVMRPAGISVAALGWGAAAGLSGAFGLAVFYRALARGSVSVVAPTSATMAAVLPVAWGLGMGERPMPATLSGVALAVVAVALVSRDPRAPRRTWAVPLLWAVAVGAGLGGFNVLINQAPEEGGFWPLAGARLASVAVLGGMIALTRTRDARPWLPAGARRPAVAAGVLDMAANVMFLIALHGHGMLSVVSVIASLYPASTLVLARYVLGERLRGSQLAGMFCAITAVALIAAT